MSAEAIEEAYREGFEDGEAQMPAYERGQQLDHPNMETVVP